MTGRDWRTAAACRDRDPELFFPLALERDGGQWSHREPDIQAVIGICDPCPVRAQCRAWADEHNIRRGIWGGLTPAQRSRRPQQGRHHHRWTDGDIRQVAAMAAAGLDDRQIGRRLGRSAEAVRHQRHRNDIPDGWRPAPPVRSTV